MWTVLQAEACVQSHAQKVALGGVEHSATRHDGGMTLPGLQIALDVLADRDMPPFDRVAMDGVAIRFADHLAGCTSFAIAATQAAGQRPLELSQSGTCIEVMTGACLPFGADTVVRYEDLQISDDRAMIQAGLTLNMRQNVHAQGSDMRAGDRVVAKGTILTPPTWAVLATVGCGSFPVTRQPKIAILGTGDELVDIATQPLPHQIRASNGYAINAACHEFGFDRTHRVLVGDQKDSLHKAFTEALESQDVLIITGAVSAGRFDCVPEVLRDLGVAEKFHKVAQRPGKPLWFGVSERGQLVFGLPGNPVSALVSCYRYVLPALFAMRGDVQCLAPRFAKLTESVDDEVFKSLAVFLPVKLHGATDGCTYATPLPLQSSGNLAALASSDGFVECPAGPPRYTSGTPLRYFSWRKNP
jgi:molybdopterin molybdotransferase